MKKTFINIVIGFFLVFSLPVSSVLAATSGPTNPYSFSAEPGKEVGTIQLNWFDDGTTKGFNLFYGLKQQNYIYSVINLPSVAPKANSFTVGALTPGQTYYFSLAGMGDGHPPVFSGPVMAQATTQQSLNQNISSANYLADHSNIPYAFLLRPGNKSGSAVIYWTDNQSANKYDIVYGTKPGEYEYGVENIPFNADMNNSFEIDHLTPYSTYYFALVAERNNNVISWTNPLSIYVQ